MLLRTSQHGHERARVRGSDHDRLHALRDHLLDQRDLLGDVGLVADAVDDQLVLGCVGGLVLLGAVGHGDEELVGERLHHQGDARPRFLAR